MKHPRFHRYRSTLQHGGRVCQFLVNVSHFALQHCQRDVREVGGYVVLQMHARKIGHEQHVRVIRPGVHVLQDLLHFVPEIRPTIT